MRLNAHQELPVDPFCPEVLGGTAPAAAAVKGVEVPQGVANLGPML